MDIDSDVLLAVKERARAERKSAGRVVSNILRNSLNGSSIESDEKSVYKNGIRILAPRKGEVITMDHIKNIMDEEGI